MSDGCRAAHLVESLERGLHQVVRVARSLGLTNNIGNADRLEDGTHSTTGLDTGTGASGLHDDAAAAELGDYLVGDGTLVNGDLDQVLLSHLGTLGDCGGDLIGLTQSVTDDTITVANNDDSGEGESATTLGNLGGAVDGNQTLLQLGVGSDLYSIIFLRHDVVS